MRKTAPTYKIQADSIVEVRRGIRDEAERLTDEGIRHLGVVLRPANLTNALMTWYLGLEPDKREAIAREGLRLFESRLMADSKAPFESPSAIRSVEDVTPPKVGKRSAARSG